MVQYSVEVLIFKLPESALSESAIGVTYELPANCSDGHFLMGSNQFTVSEYEVSPLLFNSVHEVINNEIKKDYGTFCKIVSAWILKYLRHKSKESTLCSSLF